MNSNIKRGAGVAFERIRRITGYLGTIDRFNSAKAAEVSDRVKHSVGVNFNYQKGVSGRSDR